MKRVMLILLLLGAAGGAGYYYWHRATPTEQAGTGGSRRRGGGGSGDEATPIPVLTARSETRDVPIYLDGLGTVQAFNLVSVRPMIEGPLTEIRFREGQDVRAGDLLARIDPRPYQASLDSATAKTRHMAAGGEGRV